MHVRPAVSLRLRQITVAPRWRLEDQGVDAEVAQIREEVP